MPLSLPALDRQVEEKRLAAQRLAEEEARETARRLALVAAAEAAQATAAAGRREAAAATLRAQQEQVQNAAMRTTADLTDKAVYKPFGPTPGTEAHARLGPSSAQVFSGEDPLARERARLQATQMAAWAEAAAAEKARVREEEAARER